MAEPLVIKKPGADAGAPNAAAPEPVIRTMPEKYIGAAAGKPPVVREVVETRIREVVPPPPPRPAAPKPPKKGHRRLIIIIAVGAVVLAGLGTAAYILLAPAKPAPPPATNTNTKPPAPVCGNGDIETGEQCDKGSQNGVAGSGCGSDCKTVAPPAPVCGNSAVETGEQCDIGSQNGASGSGCSADCKVVVTPPPVPNTCVDSDSDGLTDTEEATIYGTDSHSVDSEGDTFNDGNEVSHLYDPMEKAPSSLDDSSSVRKVTNAVAGYSLLIPAKWATSGENGNQFIATAPNSELFGIISASKPAEQSLVEWYLAMSPGTDANDVERTRTLQGYDALRSPDRLTTYIDANDGRVFTLTYSYDAQPCLSFRTTYDALVGSFTLTKQ
jgi:cysteine-rich repeat protein